MRFYTWKDIERYCLMNQKTWKSAISSIDVYPDEVIAYLRKGVSEEQAKKVFYNIFPKNINKENDSIKLDRGIEKIKISFEDDAEPIEKIKMPLFKQVIYNESAYPEKKLDALPCPVIVFHSYKGGVGRTLSLLALNSLLEGFLSSNNNLDIPPFLSIITSIIEPILLPVEISITSLS